MKTLLGSARRVIEKIKKSSVATQKLKAKATKVLLVDCPTRWSSTYLMVNRLLELQTSVTDVLDEMCWDHLLISEWKLLEQVSALLKPFADHTRFLEGDSVSISSIIPAIMDLEYHLIQFQHDQAILDILKPLASDLLSDLKRRFNFVLLPLSASFDPLPAAATLLDPSVCIALTMPAKTGLLQSAKDYISHLMCNAEVAENSLSSSSELHSVQAPHLITSSNQSNSTMS